MGTHQRPVSKSDVGCTHQHARGITVVYTYDSAGRYETIATYADLAGNDLVSTAAYTYDSDGRLTDLVYTFPSGSTDVAPGYHYTYDAAGRMTAMYSREDTASGRVDADYTTWARAAYNYDATGQLATTTVDNVTTSAVVYTNWTDAPSSSSESYTYDATGNRETANGEMEESGPPQVRQKTMVARKKVVELL